MAKIRKPKESVTMLEMFARGTDQILIPEKVAHQACIMARRLHGIAVKECNGTNNKADALIRARTEKKLTNYLEAHGLTVRFTGDPRGFVVKVHAPSGDVFNTWGGREEGYGIGESR